MREWADGKWKLIIGLWSWFWSSLISCTWALLESSICCWISCWACSGRCLSTLAFSYRWKQMHKPSILEWLYCVLLECIVYFRYTSPLYIWKMGAPRSLQAYIGLVPVFGNLNLGEMPLSNASQWGSLRWVGAGSAQKVLVVQKFLGSPPPF